MIRRFCIWLCPSEQKLQSNVEMMDREQQRLAVQPELEVHESVQSEHLRRGVAEDVKNFLKTDGEKFLIGNESKNLSTRLEHDYMMKEKTLKEVKQSCKSGPKCKANAHALISATNAAWEAHTLWAKSLGTPLNKTPSAASPVESKETGNSVTAHYAKRASS